MSNLCIPNRVAYKLGVKEFNGSKSLMPQPWDECRQPDKKVVTDDLQYGCVSYPPYLLKLSLSHLLRCKNRAGHNVLLLIGRGKQHTHCQHPLATLHMILLHDNSFVLASQFQSTAFSAESSITNIESNHVCMATNYNQSGINSNKWCSSVPQFLAEINLYLGCIPLVVQQQKSIQVEGYETPCHNTLQKPLAGWIIRWNRRCRFLPPRGLRPGNPHPTFSAFLSSVTLTPMCIPLYQWYNFVAVHEWQGNLWKVTTNYNGQRPFSQGSPTLQSSKALFLVMVVWWRGRNEVDFLSLKSQWLQFGS